MEFYSVQKTNEKVQIRQETAMHFSARQTGKNPIDCPIKYRLAAWWGHNSGTPLNPSVPHSAVMSIRLQEALKCHPMMPTDISLSESCAPDRCSFSCLVSCTRYLFADIWAGQGTELEGILHWKTAAFKPAIFFLANWHHFWKYFDQNSNCYSCHNTFWKCNNLLEYQWPV